MTHIPKKKFIITGCGRSGTGFMQSRLNAVGIKCGHESVFTSKGFLKWGELDGDSSWYAAPFLDGFTDTNVIHLVRNPKDVIRSFYRIGVFSTIGWINFLIDPTPKSFFRRYILKPANIKERVIHVRDIRKLVRTYTHAFHVKSELKRIEMYWIQWNLMIEKNEKTFKNNYMRVRLEDIEDQWAALLEHLGYDYVPFPENIKVNKKENYTRKVPKVIKFSKEIESLANKYGYNNQLT